MAYDIISIKVICQGDMLMEYRHIIQDAIEYIEDNLKNDINNTQIANAIGYSEYHFLRLFREYVHLTPAAYIRKRRISEIVRRMSYDTRPISDIAFEYGFNSKENFTRAFKAEHHILPTEFKFAQNSLKLYDKISFEMPECDITCNIIHLESFNIVAYQSDEDFTPNFWNKYNAKGYSKKLSGGAAVMDYGVCIWNFDKMKLDYWIGIRETDAKGDLSDSVVLHIKGGLYAVFETPKTSHFNFVNNIHRTWNYIADVWFPNSGYIRTGDYEFECYVEESRLYTETIYIPITKKTENN